MGRIDLKQAYRNHWAEYAAQSEMSDGIDAELAGPITDYYRDKRKKAVAALLDLDFEDSVLEVGAGPGGNLVAIAGKHPDMDVIGCDVNEAMCQAAAKNGARVVLSSQGKPIPFKTKGYHTVFTMTVLQSIEDAVDLEFLVSEICRVARVEIVIFEDVLRDHEPVGPTSPTYSVRPINAYCKLFDAEGWRCVDSTDIAGPRESLEVGRFYRIRYRQKGVLE
jgi:SAM-dependent methyltransferase